MKASVLLPGNSANTVCMTSEKGKVARQQQVVRQAGVRGWRQRPGLVTIKENRCLKMAHSHVYSLRAERDS